ncbi:MAG: hypothetical protein IPG44_17400 [Anaerolineales bacterium]|nr:hypothetical protein [Anaerolineales bacterium]
MLSIYKPREGGLETLDTIANGGRVNGRWNPTPDEMENWSTGDGHGLY